MYPNWCRKGGDARTSLVSNYKYSYILMMCRDIQKQLKYTITVIHSCGLILCFIQVSTYN